jgi:hypothetical protein
MTDVYAEKKNVSGSRKTIRRGQGGAKSEKRGSYYGSQIPTEDEINAHGNTATSPTEGVSPIHRKFSRLNVVQTKDNAKGGELAFAFEGSTPTHGGSYRQQGDKKMEMASNVLRRRKASASRGVANAIDRLWGVFSPDQKDQHGRVFAQDGINVMILIIKALYDPSEVNLIHHA